MYFYTSEINILSILSVAFSHEFAASGWLFSPYYKAEREHASVYAHEMKKYLYNII